jgi:cell division protein FtsW
MYLMTLVLAGVLIALLGIFILSQLPEKGRFGTWKQRIESFRATDEVPYQVKQAKIAVAKGGLMGNGPGNSAQRNFLPHPYSDFIFAIIIEEYGLFGGLVLLFLYMLLIFRAIMMVVKSPGTFGALLAVGLALCLVLQGLIHMAVSVSLLPVTGLTLPLVSMGGTSLFFTSIAMGIILSVSRSIEQEELIIQQENQPQLESA